MDLALLAGHWVKWKEREKIDKYKDFAREIKNTEDEDDGDTICNWWLRTIPKRLVKGLDNLEIGWQVETIIKISQNTEKITRNLRKLAIILTPVNSQQLSVVWKNLNVGNNKVLSYLPTPPLGQDMTQGQFLSGV